MIKVYCSGLDLSAGISKVINAVATKTVNPILEGIKIEARDNYIKLIGSDGNLTIIDTIRADVKIDGVAVVNAKFINDYLKQLAKFDIDLELNEKNQLKIKCEDSEAVISTYDSKEYPKLPKTESNNSFKIKSEDFKNLVRKTIISVATDNIRPLLKGVKFEIFDNKVVAIAIDGYRLSSAETDIDYSGEKCEFIVNGKDLRQILKLITDGTTLTINFNEFYLSIEIDDTIVISRLLDGKFIDCEKVFPKSYATKVRIDKETLLNSLSKCEIFTKQLNQHYVIFNIDNRLFNIQFNSSDYSFSNDLIMADMQGEELKVKYNLSYIQDCLSVIDDCEICFNFSEGVKSLTIEQQDCKFKHLILPLKD